MTINDFIKKIVKKFLVFILIAIPLDWVLHFSQYISSAIAKIIFFRDWHMLAYGRPKFFKHQINLSHWRFEPFRWSFTARGVYAREHMFKGCVVLDLCCGDGSYSYLFFSDIAGKIDAIDNDPYALAYAKRFYTTPIIYFHKINIVEQKLPSSSNFYDVVIWNAAISYFSESEIRTILNKTIKAGKSSMVLCGMLPKGFGYVDHLFEFQTSDLVVKFLQEYFSTVSIKEVSEMTNNGTQPNISFYFCASNPLPTE